jgi:hypothetical protein
MNKLESEYLTKNSISLNDWLDILTLVGSSTYLKINQDCSEAKLTRTKYYKILKKFKDADLVKQVKGEYRLNPYFYLRNDCSKALATKLQNEWDNEPEKGKSEHLPKTITDPVTGELYLYDDSEVRPMDKTLGWYRPATVEDYEN